MANKVSATQRWLQNTVIRASRIHFVVIFVYIAVIVIYDSWRVITPEIVLQRWTMIGIFATVSVLIWALARVSARNTLYYQSLIYAFILLDIAFATFNIYTQRGMASRAVMLYALPIAVAALLRSRSVIFATASISAASYVLSAVRYFVVHFNEGYKVELYAELLFYSFMMFVLASLLWLVVRSQSSS